MLPMREDAFISKNMARWRRIEMQVASASFASTDEMVEIYTDISSDLAYAQTHFPQSAVWRFLNNLTLELHGVMYRKRHPRWHRLLTYWTHDVPLAVYDGRCIVAGLHYSLFSHLEVFALSSEIALSKL